MRFVLTLILNLLTFSLVSSQVLHASSRWIVDSNNKRVKLRCVNWAGHMETNIPEGLHHQSTATLAAWIANAGFNCVRLTYSIDMALNPAITISSSFTSAAAAAGVAKSDMQNLYSKIASKNSWVSSKTTVQDAFANVIDELGKKNVMVVLDNHVSRASWCCSQTDGNGWWSAASGYVAANSQYFDVANWTSGLAAMANFAAQHKNVVGMSLRNELRAVSGQDGNNHADWYKYVKQGADAVHGANSNLLVVIGGVNYATDMSYLYSTPFDRSSYGNKVVWEFHNYQWTFSTNNCNTHQSQLGSKTGFLLTQGKTYTGPLWLSEFGWAQNGPTADETAYVSCLVNYMEQNDADWAYWALMGSYYVRDKQIDYDESFGLLTQDWSGWRNASFVGLLGKMWNVTQGP